MSIDTTDQDLLTRVRSGDTAAFGDLYAHHSAGAHRAARRIVRDPHLAEDLVSESFARVFSALRGETGPRGDLFPYLLVTMRNVAATWGRDTVRWTPVGDDVAFQPRDARDVSAAADEAPVDQLAVSLTSSAFTTLPRRWRTVLWYLEVEGESASEVGQRLGLSDVAVRQLARRAREGLREAYLTAYLGGSPPAGAHIPAGDLAQMARGKISPRRRTQVEAHLDTCPQCTRMLFEAAEENSTLRALAIPFYLVAAFAVFRGAGHVRGWLHIGGKGRQLGNPATAGATAGGAAVAVVVVTAIAGGWFTGSGGHQRAGPGAGPVAAGGPSASAPAATTSSSRAAPTPITPTPAAPTPVTPTSAVRVVPAVTGGPATSTTVPTPAPPGGDLQWSWQNGSVDVDGVTTTTLKITNTTATAWGIDASFDLPDGVTLGSTQSPGSAFCTQTGKHVGCRLHQQFRDNLDALEPGWTSFHPIQFTNPRRTLVAPAIVTFTLVPAK